MKLKSSIYLLVLLGMFFLIACKDQVKKEDYTFCYRIVSLTLYGNGNATLIKHGSDGSVADSSNGKWTAEGSPEDKSGQTIKTTYEGMDGSIDYKLFRNENGSPSHIIDMNGNRANLCIKPSATSPSKENNPNEATIEKIDYKDGHRYYYGQVLNGVENGKGKLYYDGALVYEGDWKNGNPNGQGKLYVEGVLRYEGGIKNGKMNGKGKFTMESGQIAVGVWKDGEYVENSATSDNGIVIRSEELSDNPQNYIGKTITVDLVYTSGLNENLSLRCGEYESEERARSAVVGFYEDNEQYYTRVSDSNAGTLFYLRIPYRIRNSVPNTESSIILVTGVLKNKSTIIVKSIKRVN